MFNYSAKTQEQQKRLTVTVRSIVFSDPRQGFSDRKYWVVAQDGTTGWVGGWVCITT